DELLRARAQVQDILDGLKGERTLIKAKEAKQRLAEIEEQGRARLTPAGESVPVEQLKAGDRIELISLGVTGALLEPPQGKKRVRVRVGETDMSVDVSGLVGFAGPASEDDAQTSHSSRPDRSLRPASTDDREVPTVLDVRGRTAEEALDLTISALDRAALAGAPFLRIIHGHGTGRLKAALRDYLKASPYVSTFRAGERAEGGDGVTIVELK
ncbi:MAG: Smr/MutS family protein, partial [Nitrospiraceae bacterium]